MEELEGASTNHIYSKTNYKSAIPGVIIYIFLFVSTGLYIITLLIETDIKQIEKLAYIYMIDCINITVIGLLKNHYGRQKIILNDYGIEHRKERKRTIFIPWDNFSSIITFPPFYGPDGILVKTKGPIPGTQIIRREHVISYIEISQRIELFKKMAGYAKQRDIEIVDYQDYLSK